MNSRWFNLTVFALWLTTMSWLVIVKILPSLLVGDPPDRVAILAAQAEEQLVGYEVRWEEKQIGWALIRGGHMPGGATLIDGQIRFDRLPIQRMVPDVFLTLLGLDGSLPEQIQLDAKSQVLFHASGRLQRFESTLSIDPGISTIRVEGFVVGETVLLTIRSAGATFETRRALPRNVMVNDGLMPQSQMPGLREGRKWTVEVYSPLRPRTDPMEIMQAEVVGRDLLTWAGQVENAWLVIYRGDPGSGVGRAEKEHAWLWVRDDGVVLQHRIALLDSTLTFVRMPDGGGYDLQQLLGEQPLTASSDGDAPLAARGADSETEAEAKQP